MKITPLEIRQKEFEKNFRGYDKDEVNAFLQTLSQEWERTLEENRNMRYKMEAAEREVEKLREVESSLFKTLRSAEDTGATMIDQANKTAELRIRESNIKAEEMLSEARLRSKAIVEKAEQKARQLVEEIQIRINLLRESYKEAEGDYEDLTSKLKNLATETLRKVEKAEGKQKYDIDRKVEEVAHAVEKYHESEDRRRQEEAEAEHARQDARQQRERAQQEEARRPIEKEKVTPAEPPAREPEEAVQTPSQNAKPERRRSFFDEIE